MPFVLPQYFEVLGMYSKAFLSDSASLPNIGREPRVKKTTCTVPLLLVEEAGYGLPCFNTLVWELQDLQIRALWQCRHR